MQPNAKSFNKNKYWLDRQLPFVVIGGDEVGGHLLSKDAARRIAANVAKLPELGQT